MATNTIPLHDLLNDIRACRICEPHLPLGPNPVVRANHRAKLLIIGQAPGTKVHETSIPWNDPSGDRLRDWLGLSREQFYDDNNIAIVPMGFCYPGKGKSGDLPPRPECAEHWHDQVVNQLKKVELTLLIGNYAHAHHLENKDKKFKTLTERVKAWRQFTPQKLPLVHPSPRNQLWLKKNPWFEKEVVPYLRRRVKKILRD